MKTILSLLLLLVITSCKTPSIEVMDLKDGRVTTISMSEINVKIGDTIVVETFNNHSKYYGKYIGVIPVDRQKELITLEGKVILPVKYNKVIRTN